jgi:hypothetical protein
MPRSSVPKAMLVVLSVLALLALEISINTNGLGRGVRRTTTPYGAAPYGFGGYQVGAHATEVGARWDVPTITPESSNGGASTWIGVQSSANQFIQLGTTEEKNDAVIQYEVFWSDVTVDFHPQQLLEVDAGDTIDFDMTQVPRGWRLHFDDVTEKVRETKTIPYANGASFDAAEWLQEDPTIGGLATHVEYPSIGVPSFSKMSLDNAHPKVYSDDGQVLSTQRGVNLVPTKPAHDGFTFKNATGAARQYLVDVFAFNSALYPFQVDVYENRSPTGAVLYRINSTLATLATNLKNQHWPTRLRSAVSGDVQVVDSYATLFASLPEAPAPLSATEVARIDAVSQRNHPIADTIRRELGLPPLH